MMLKQKPHEDKKWLIELRSHPCLFTGKTEVEAAHVRKGAHAGMKQKPHDYFAIPLHFAIHREEHQHGAVTTFLKYFGMYPTALFDVVRGYARLQYLCWLVKMGKEKKAIKLMRE